MKNTLVSIQKEALQKACIKYYEKRSKDIEERLDKYRAFLSKRRKYIYVGRKLTSEEIEDIIYARCKNWHSYMPFGFWSYLTPIETAENHGYYWFDRVCTIYDAAINKSCDTIQLSLEDYQILIPYFEGNDYDGKLQESSDSQDRE